MSEMSDILEFLFKFRPVIFEKGELALRPLLPWYGVVLLAAAALAFAFLLYRRVEGSVGRPWRRGLALIRLLPLLILMAIVLQPVLVLQAVVPQQNFLAIAYDASKSMEIKDGPGRESRLAAVEQLLLPGGGSLRADLEQKFKLRFFRFAGNVERTEGFQAGPRRGNFTDLGRALGHIAGEMGSVPLAGVILLTDGSDNRSSDLSTAVSQMRALNTPIFPIGIGSEDLGRDLEVLRVSTPQKVLKDALVEADVTVRSTGYAGRRTKILVKEGDRVLQSREITLGGDDEVKTYKLSFTGDTVGARTLSFRAEPIGDEVVVENNDRM
ncbi:MAG: VWA domain-containing protein, partial [Acidobacteria bacterium]|nr:VWA domain-containing protein [Acidobacteriota bacterium]